MKIKYLIILSVFLFSSTAQAALVGVSGPVSNFPVGGTAAAIIPAPDDALDNLVFNTGQQGFNEAQNVTLLANYSADGGVVLTAGQRVSSHMIFLNKDPAITGNIPGAQLTHLDVVWEFANKILAVMSNANGSYEAASTGELGLATTNYDAPFAFRGLEAGGSDAYSVNGNELTLSMAVTEPGDWIRVVTAVPVPAAVWLFGTALIGLIGFGRRKITA